MKNKILKVKDDFFNNEKIKKLIKCSKLESSINTMHKDLVKVRICLNISSNYRSLNSIIESQNQK